MSCGTCSGAGLGKLNLTDFQKGLLVAVLGAVLSVLYESFSKGFPTSWTALQPVLINAAGVGITAGIAYLMKNLGTGSGGQILTNKPREEVKDVPKT